METPHDPRRAAPRPPAGRRPSAERPSAPGHSTGRPRRASADREGFAPPAAHGAARPAGPPRPRRPRAPRPAEAQDRPSLTDLKLSITTPPVPRATADRTVRRTRAVFLGTLMAISVVCAQLVRLQVVDAEPLRDEGRKLRFSNESLDPRRGDIVDVTGAPLAATIRRYDVNANQEAVREYKIKDPATTKMVKVGVPGAAAALAPILKMDKAELERKLTGDRKWVQVALRVPPLTWRQIEGLRIPGISPTAQPMRDYPFGKAASTTVGWYDSATTNDQGVTTVVGGGLESMLASTLNGQPGRKVSERSRDGRVIPMGETLNIPAVPGSTVHTTLDGDLMNFAYTALQQAVDEHEADFGTVVVQEVKDGKLRAVTQYPSFDPGKKRGAKEFMANMAFQDTFEPGSTTKVMTLGAALQEKVTTPTAAWTIPNRLDRRVGKAFKDSHDHPTLQLTTAGVLAQSSNIGTILIGEKLPKETLHNYFSAFGVGARTEVRFPGEGTGIFSPASDWNRSQRYTVMFGQGISMTAVQTASVFQTVANGGVRMPVSLIDRTVAPDGTVTRPDPGQATKVLTPEVSHQLVRMLEAVVGEGGTAKEAMVPGYRVAGKTGTADRYDMEFKGYKGKTASFIGFAPANNPKYVVSVVLQNPKKQYYGGTTAGPVFRHVMQYALQRAGISADPTPPTPYPLEVGKNAPTPDGLAVDEKAVSKTSQASPTSGQRR